MASNENPDQEIERVLQTHFESEAEGLKAPAGLWGRIESRLRDDLWRTDEPPIWQRLLQPGRWGLSPALTAMAVLVLAVSGTWLFTATPWRDDGVNDFALQGGAFQIPASEGRGPSRYAALPTPTPAPHSAPGATAAPLPTSVPTASLGGPQGAAGAAGAPGATGYTRNTSSGSSIAVNGSGFGSLAEEDVSDRTNRWGATQNDSDPSLDNFALIPAAPTQSPLPSPSTGQNTQLEVAQRQIISQGSVSVEVEGVPSATDKVRVIAEGFGGFVEQLTSQGVEERQQSTMTIRVPQPEFFAAFNRIKLLGKVLNENAGSEDVTERFIDLEARLNSAEREEQSLLSLLERAEKVSEILTIERELTRIRTELEQVQGQLNFLERRVDLATITVALYPPAFRGSQPPSAALTLEVGNVSQRVEEVKALVSAAGGELDQVYTSVQDGTERAILTARVFAKDFDRVLSAIESQGKVKAKEVREGTTYTDSTLPDDEAPDSRIDLSINEQESSNTSRWITIGAPVGGVALVIVLGLLFYATYRTGQRRGE
ncbi:MAG: DUF4349 domain-containing protein [SAR202 cluster bacterium]|nr:DUF4349 domain-containing protein [SAR202 cluster bacterium]